MTASAQIAGNTSANIAEVEAGTKALRTTLRDIDFGSLGIYKVGGVTAFATTNLTALSDIFSFRWGNASNLALIRRVTISAGVSSTLGAAGVWQAQLFVARSFSGSQTGGTSLLPSGSQNKLRTTGMGTTLLTDARISSTAALGAGTKTLDTQSVGSVVSATPVTAGTQLLAPYPIFDVRPGEYPLVLAQNEGLVLQALHPATTGAWQVGVTIEWAEVLAY
jgi:hypothetical protein